MNGQSDSEAAHEPVLFDRVLLPHRSLSRAGMAVLIVVLVGASAAIGTGFALMGAWPVIGFCGLDILVICLALRLSVLSARRSEHVRLTRRSLEIRASDGRGPARHTVMHPYWTRVEFIARRRARLLLRSHGRSLELGSFLASADKQEVARSLAGALRQVRVVPSATAR
ncbi:MAG: DUF2244 domain-containing protein [Alphaproteobacteria bacterium]|nr:DUF2244 domain-containing protein [Alphaproteobacteria bacterium]